MRATLVLLCCLGSQALRSTRVQRPAHRLDASIDSASFYVSDLTRSAAFYSEALGLQASEGEDSKDRKSFHLLGSTKISLLQARTISPEGIFDLDEGMSGLGVVRAHPPDVMDLIEMNGGTIRLPAAEYNYAASLEPDEDELKLFPVRMGVAEDPDGYRVEVKYAQQGQQNMNKQAKEVKDNRDAKLVAKGQAVVQEGLVHNSAKIVLKVEDLNDCITFYQSLGMTLLRKRSNVYNTPKEASMMGYVGFESETDGVYLVGTNVHVVLLYCCVYG